MMNDIPTGWNVIKLGEIANISTGKRPPYKENFKTQEFQIPVYGGNGIAWYTNSILIENPVILTGRVGTIGTIYKVTEPAWVSDNAIIITPINVDFNCLFYLLKQIDLKGLNRGSTQPLITQTDVKNLAINLPPLEEQKKIAGILGSLDDKIELLRDENKTLEAMAQAIFKSWFVDFDIVKAKAKGTPKEEVLSTYKITEDIYNLFPDSFTDSPLGQIPTGWEVKKLGDFFPIKTGKKDANIAVENGIYPFFTCGQETSKTNEFSFDAEAILLAGNGDFNIKWYRGKFEAYQRTYVLIPTNPKYLDFLYWAMKHFLIDITAGYKGSVIRFITKGMIEDYKLLLCPNNMEDFILKSFSKINNKIEENNKQIQTLTETRDTLLPQLISGKIRV